jgi:hypothetical protein
MISEHNLVRQGSGYVNTSILPVLRHGTTIKNYKSDLTNDFVKNYLNFLQVHTLYLKCLRMHDIYLQV